jgi:site-specific recombinase XerD
VSPLNHYLLDFEAYLQQQQKETRTIRMYLREVAQFLKFLQNQQKTLLQLDQADLLQYREHLLQKRIKVSTINKSLSTLSSFFKWARQNGYIQKNFAEQLRLYENNSFPPSCLTRKQEQLLLEVAANEKNPFKRARNEALIAIMLYGGLRIEEVSKLQRHSIKNKYLLVIDQGEISREVPLRAIALEKIRAWIKVRNQLKKKMYVESSSLFVTERSGKMQPRAIQYVVEGYSKKLGFPISCQILRNTFCHRLVEDGKTPEEVQYLAGHNSILTSYKYFQFRR